MRARICDECKKSIDNESYYTIGEVSYTDPDDKFTRVSFSKGESSERTAEDYHSYVDYRDLDFCATCWDKLPFKKYLEDKR